MKSPSFIYLNILGKIACKLICLLHHVKILIKNNKNQHLGKDWYKPKSLKVETKEDLPIYDAQGTYPYHEAVLFFIWRLEDGFPTSDQLENNHSKTKDIWFSWCPSYNSIFWCKISKCPQHSCWWTGTTSEIISHEMFGHTKISYLHEK